MRKRPANRVLQKHQPTNNQHVKHSLARPIRPILDPDRLANNPLASSDFTIPVMSVTIPGRYRREGDVILPAEATLESDQKSQVYVSASMRKSTMNLSPSATKLFLWVLYELEPGVDYLWINRKRYMEEAGVSMETTYESAAEELCRYCYLHAVPWEGMTDVFWINPSVMFCGSRTKRYPGKLHSR